jgi:WD40 repeat protein
VIGGKPLATLSGAQGTIFAIAFRPDGQQVAAAGMDGMVRIFALPAGTLVKAFIPVPVQAASGRTPRAGAVRPAAAGTAAVNLSTRRSSPARTARK